MKALLIAEKPSLMRTIQEVYRNHRGELGLTIDFKAQAGHLLGLKMPDEINPVYKKWSMDNLPLHVPFNYKIMNGKSKLVSDIKNAIKHGDYDFIIHAGDPDQEGEILIRETLAYAGNRLPVKRFWSNDLTEDAVLQALRNLEDDRQYDNLASAGFVRQHEDYNYGINLTECMTLKSKTLIRMGRVKAPIMKAIVDREQEIEDFVPSSVYQRAFLYNHEGTDYQFIDDSETFENEELLSKSVKTVPTKAEVVKSKTEEKFAKAPKLYKLSTLQSDAYSKLHFPASTTLSVLQSLYEKKLVSYPRSACEYISSGVDVAGIYNSLKGMTPEISSKGIKMRSASVIRADKRYCNDKAIASEGHTGIIPTGKHPSDISDAEKKLYSLIVRRFLAICVEPKKMLQTTIEAKDENGYVYTCKGVKDVDPSYEYILNPAYKTKDFNFKPENHSILNPVVFSPKEIEKKCPSRFNEGTLIKFLANPKEYEDDDGNKVKYTIGTEATRANIIEECVKNGYFTKEKGVYAPTEFARTICREYGDLDIFQIDYSAQWESIFDNIRNGELNADAVETDLTSALNDMIADVKGRTVTEEKARGASGKKKTGEEICDCPYCKTGKIRENSKAFGCSNWNAEEKCNFTLWKSCFGAKLTKTDAKKLIAGKTIEKTLTSKAGKKYKKELAYDFDNGKVVWAENLREQDYSR